jgi:hypothetical protein
MTRHFEQLWESCEQSFQNTDAEVGSIINELLIKANLYRAISKQDPKSPEEMEKIKSHLMGEILLTLTHLSLKENINVFNSLTEALFFSNVEKRKEAYSSSEP